MKKLILFFAFILLLKHTYSQSWNTTLQPFNGMGQGHLYCLLSDTANNLLYSAGSFAFGPWYVTVFDGTTWDTLGTSFNNQIFDICLYNGNLYACGYFTANGTTPLNYIARWDGISWQQVGGGTDTAPRCLRVYNNELYVGGYFLQAGGMAANRIAKWNGSAWSTFGTGANNAVSALYDFNGELYVGGYFTSIDGTSLSHVAKWDGSTWLPLGSGTNGAISDIIDFNGDLCFTGGFGTAGGVSVSAIAKWNGSQWSAMGAGLDMGAQSLCIYNGDLYACGGFTTSGTTTLNGVARWNSYSWSSPGNPPNNTKACLAFYNNQLYVGGFALFNLATNCLVVWTCPASVQPVAAFTVNDSLIQTGSYVKFTDQSTGNSLSQEWSFPGGIPSSSILQNPVVQYTTTGVYDVTLVVINGVGRDTLTKSSYINASPMPDAIDSGITIEYVPFDYDIVFNGIQPNTVQLDTCAKGLLEVYYYKPPTYNPATSPILWSVHGLGGNGINGIANLQDIADRRQALIVAVSMIGPFDNSYLMTFEANLYNTYFSLYPSVLKQLYRNVLYRESRSNVPVYLTGWSQGAQFVTRYMLMRQGVPDSIPIQMAMSVSPWYYTFCTDTFLSVPMPFSCGITGNVYIDTPASIFSCNEHVIQYYNENYAVLVGTWDVATGGNSCMLAQGTNRIERAQNFYAFSDSNAVTRGTTLQWQYGEIPGIGHSQSLMYTTKASPTDSSTIAETLLFDTPYHPVPSLAPIANFYPDTTITVVNGTINFTNTSINSSGYVWDFGDGGTSTLTNPSHVYTVPGTYAVKLTSDNGNCSNTVVKKCYIEVLTPVALNQNYDKNTLFKILPNPANTTLTLTARFFNNQNIEGTIYNSLGENVYFFKEDLTANAFEKKISIEHLSNGMYYLHIKTRDELFGEKIIIRH